MSDITPERKRGSGYEFEWEGRTLWFDPDDCKGTAFHEFQAHQAALERQRKERTAERESRLKYERAYNPFGCFVATSAFENQEHPTVELLRQYRDEILVYNPIGRLFNRAYYGGAGQAGAKVLDRLPRLKPAVRKGLEALVARVVKPALKAKQYDSQRSYGNLVTVR